MCGEDGIVRVGLVGLHTALDAIVVVAAAGRL
jgi:hypothetical protein